MNALSNRKMTSIIQKATTTKDNDNPAVDRRKTPASRKRIVTAEELKVSGRFFQVFEVLKDRGVIKTTKFQEEFGINRGNFNTLRSSPERRALPIYLLVIMVEKYGVDANWLLTGSGKMFGTKKSASGSQQEI